jgi:hypothetical protein
VDEMKASYLNVNIDSDLEPDREKQIIDSELNVTIVATKVHPKEPKESEEGECLFHSHMWVKGSSSCTHGCG